MPYPHTRLKAQFLAMRSIVGLLNFRRLVCEDIIMGNCGAVLSRDKANLLEFSIFGGTAIAW